MGPSTPSGMNHLWVRVFITGREMVPEFAATSYEEKVTDTGYAITFYKEGKAVAFFDSSKIDGFTCELVEG